MKTINIIGLLVIALLLGYIAFIKPNKVVHIPTTYYKTDTVFVKEPYEVPKPYPVQVPPKIVYRYYEGYDSLSVDSLLWVIQDNKLIIDYLSENLEYSRKFLTTYPENPKLISFDLSRDEMDLSLIFTNGDLSVYKYPLNFDSYKYRWTVDNQLTRTTDIKPIIKDKDPFSVYGGIGYDFISTSPYLSFSTEQVFGKFRGYMKIDVGLLDIESTDFKVGLDYRLTK